MNKIFFLQMIGIGLEARVVESAAREIKSRIGWLAYGLATIQSIANPPMAHYHMELDDQIVETDGVTCMVLNADNLNLPGISGLPPGPRKGLLDVFIPLHADARAIFSIAATMAGGGPELVMIPHWQARHVFIQTDPPQLVQSDGEVIGYAPVKARVTERKVRIIVTPQKAAALLDYTAEAEEAEQDFEEYLTRQPSPTQVPEEEDLDGLDI